MKPIKFPGHNVEFAKNQPQYLPLPAKYDRNDPNGAVTTQWELTAQEINFIFQTGTLYLTVLTFHNPLQPILASVFEPGTNNCDNCGGGGCYYCTNAKSTIVCEKCNGIGKQNLLVEQTVESAAMVNLRKNHKGHPDGAKYGLVNAFIEGAEWQINKKPKDGISFEDCLREEFLVNTQNYPKEYHDLFNEKFQRAQQRFEELSK